MKVINLTQGQCAFVDDADFEWLSQWKWHAKYDRSTHTFYSYSTRRNVDGKQFSVQMHREILGLHRGDRLLVDHVNGNTLDNRRANLRIATNAENLRNRGKQANNTSGFKGVTWHKQCAKWQGAIKVNGKHIHLGLFADPREAHEAYSAAASKYHGEFGRTA